MMERFIRFNGATAEAYDDGVEYTPRGEIDINVDQIVAVYDHTILTGGHKIRVMKTLEEIQKMLAK